MLQRGSTESSDTVFFRARLFSLAHASSPRYPVCLNMEETPEQVVFQCPRFAEMRKDMRTACNVNTVRATAEVAQRPTIQHRWLMSVHISTAVVEEKLIDSRRSKSLPVGKLVISGKDILKHQYAMFQTFKLVWGTMLISILQENFQDLNDLSVYHHTY